MKKWLTHCTIFCYLSALAWGVVSHTVSFGSGSHPVMYYLVWDMFGGWSSYSSRMIVIGEGESGKYYELSPGPWGEYRPFGSIGRRHYDNTGMHAPRMAMNALKHTKHEPIHRMYVVEETWAKKYNLPDKLWKRRFDEPKVVNKYHQVLHVYSPTGERLESYPNWLTRQFSFAVGNNPRLIKEQQLNRPFFAVKYRNRERPVFFDSLNADTAARRRIGSRLGNGN